MRTLCGPLLAVGLLLGGCSAPRDPGTVPLWNAGDTWEYLRITFDPETNVTERKTTSLVVVDTSGVFNGTPVYTVRVTVQNERSVLVNYTRADLNEIDARNELRGFAFPLSVGKSWTSVANYDDGNATSDSVVTAERKGVAVPAGAYDAYEIVSHAVVRDVEGTVRGDYSITVLFSPTVKNRIVEEQVDALSGQRIRLELQRAAVR